MTILVYTEPVKHLPVTRSIIQAVEQGSLKDWKSDSELGLVALQITCYLQTSTNRQLHEDTSTDKDTKYSHVLASKLKVGM